MRRIDRIRKYISENRLNIYDVAVMTDEGIESAYCQNTNRCHNTYSVTKVFINLMVGILCDEGSMTFIPWRTLPLSEKGECTDRCSCTATKKR